MNVRMEVNRWWADLPIDLFSLGSITVFHCLSIFTFVDQGVQFILKEAVRILLFPQ